MLEKRDTERLNYTNRITVMDSNTGRILTKEARLQNISAKGIAFVSDEPLMRGITYRFHMILNGTALTLIGKVMHLKKDPYMCIGGAKIESISLSDRIRINRFLMVQSQKWQLRFLFRALLFGALAALLLKMLMGIGLSNTIALFLVLSTLIFVLFPF